MSLVALQMDTSIGGDIHLDLFNFLLICFLSSSWLALGERSVKDCSAFSYLQLVAGCVRALQFFGRGRWAFSSWTQHATSQRHLWIRAINSNEV